MKTYILRRFLQMIPLLFGISALTFLLLQMAPGDFLNQMGENPAISPATTCMPVTMTNPDLSGGTMDLGGDLGPPGDM